MQIQGTPRRGQDGALLPVPWPHDAKHPGAQDEHEARKSRTEEEETAKEGRKRDRKEETKEWKEKKRKSGREKREMKEGWPYDAKHQGAQDEHATLRSRIEAGETEEAKQGKVGKEEEEGRKVA